MHARNLPAPRPAPHPPLPASPRPPAHCHGLRPLLVPQVSSFLSGLVAGALNDLQESG